MTIAGYVKCGVSFLENDPLTRGFRAEYDAKTLNAEEQLSGHQ
jgi:hypothetical protein